MRHRQTDRAEERKDGWIEGRGLIKRNRNQEVLKKKSIKKERKTKQPSQRSVMETNVLYGDVAPVPALHLSVPHWYRSQLHVDPIT